jgi:hypothetical protein
VKLYPRFQRCTTIFDSAIHQLADAVSKADDAALDARTKWANTEIAVWQLLPRMVFHNGTHCGQIADLRRALAIGSIFA